MPHPRTHSAVRVAAGVAAALALVLGLAQPAAARGSDVFPGGLYRPADTTASRQASALAAAGRTADAAVARAVAARPSSTWLGDWLSTAALRTTVARHLSAAADQGKTPVFVTYAIPGRDCGSFSAGGLTPGAYGTWNRVLADTLRGHRAAVIVEPDALAQLSTCPGADATQRTKLIRAAVHDLAGAGASVYIDAGHENWIAPAKMATLLREAGVAEARGFSLNVSNSYATAGERAYGEQLRRLVGGHYVIDVSRNGRGATGEWCNARAAGVGQDPAVVNDATGLDALLWVKLPGESDGTCNGGPAAGQWFPAGAAALLRNR
ncbi:glycoside hydrolase family 6 protein [Curtobacterium sp. MCPF17_002]|uniref:glycoside hydrolase family 6 protein n=1 Tax=Curtobacterium sp. MCPF17_002 TaxID=2175645 RepID=UPI000DA77E9E|nr:glycoside hydrolase family 6 protein [Curtobacterium sp. MCPF17_002]WIB77588.1 glycoside hydrolase family 6 protein [Curtobacterium sp. MCPF17_002]